MTYTYNLVDIHIFAQQTLMPLLNDYRIFTLTGTLGTGKTTLIKAWLSAYGISQPVTSPTFTYLNIYQEGNSSTFYHFDLYRIKTLEDFLDAGFDEFLSTPHAYCFIEWPDLIKPLLCDQTYALHVCSLELSYDLTIPTQRTMEIIQTWCSQKS